MKRRILQGLVLSLLVLIFPVLGQAAALTPGNDYRVAVDAIGSNGAVVVLGFNEVVTADVNGKISFSFTGLPDRTSYNFFVITVRDEITADTVRRSLVPVAVEGATTDLGVSLVTGAQTQALLSAMASAGSDNPIMVALGMTIVRNAALTDAELVEVGKMGIDAATAFETDLLTHDDVNADSVTVFKSKIVDRLGEFSSLYKDSAEVVGALEVGVPNAADFRGEAANLMLKIMVDSATEAGFSEDYVYLAFEATSAVVTANYLAGDYVIPLPIMMAINSQMSSGMQGMRAEKSLKKWTDALDTLGATTAQHARFTEAATALKDAMKTAFQAFEQLFQDPENVPTDAAVTEKGDAIGTAMQAAFDQFMTDSASSLEEIDALRTSMYDTFGMGDGSGTDMDTVLPADMFKFSTSTGESINWPITMVVPTSWAVTVQGAGGSLTYTPRDTTTVPDNMAWLDSWDYQNPAYWVWNDPNYHEAGGHYDLANYVANKTRHDFGTANDNGINGDEKDIPASLASLMGLREDIQILEMTKWANMEGDGGNRKALEEAFLTSISTVKGNIGGTSATGVSVTDVEKDALITLSLSPEF